MRGQYFAVVLFLLLPGFCHADGPADNRPEQVRAVPPAGIELPAEDKQQLTSGLQKLDTAIAALRRVPENHDLLPDVEIFARAIRQGVTHNELFSKRDIVNAHKVLAEGLARAQSLAAGESPWTTAKGLVVRGFRSKIDNTVQPYGLVVPATYSTTGKQRFRVDLWLHGRGERSTEPVFIHERMTRQGRFAPRDTIVLHPYGRYSNAFKFAGEVDILEALQHAKQHYRVDENQIAIRGFSMGGAGCWQMAVHYPGMFFAANPGAGFSETPEFLKFFQKETLSPPWYEEKLWRMYDCPGYVSNLLTLPTVAYSGELDIQKQAADIMETAYTKNGMHLTHLIGPGTKHAIHPSSMKVIESKLDQLAEVGRNPLPREIRFSTYTLKYNRSHWLTVTGMRQHWEQASVRAFLHPQQPAILIDADNVTSLKITIPAGRAPWRRPFRNVKPVVVQFSDGPTADGKRQAVTTHPVGSDQSWECQFHYDGAVWKTGPAPAVPLAKRHNLQGPIDDAFMSSFILVRPTGKAQHAVVDKWSRSELSHMQGEWRRQFRGDAVVKDDTAVTAQDIANSNLVLFGDAASNSIIRKVVKSLPVTWTAESISVGEQKFDAAHHAPVLIYPNPLNPQRYVVINSGFTYREYAYLNNARQTPKLPDWAVIDLRTPAGSQWPGKVAGAGFFDEAWRVKATGNR